MSKFKLLFVFGCLVLMFAVNPANVYGQAEEGDKEILINGHVLSMGGDYGTTMAYATFNYGVFISDTLQVGGGPNISYSKFAGDGNLSINLNGFVRHYFLSEGKRTVYYAGGEIAISDAFGSTEGLSFTDKLYIKPLVGLKYYFIKRAAIDANLGYGIGFSKGAGGMLTLSFGVSIIL